MDVNKKIEELKIVPVVVLHNADNAVPLADALIQGGLPIAEITFRTEAAEASIRAITERFPEMLVGAGTIVTVEQAKKAVSAGAKFLVSAGLAKKLQNMPLKIKSLFSQESVRRQNLCICWNTVCR